MARKNAGDLCFICGSAPCECNKPAKPKKQPKQKVKTEQIKAESVGSVTKRTAPSFREAMKTAAAQAPISSPKITAPSVKPGVSRPILSDEEIVFNDAIRTLARAGLLREEDRQKYRAVITSGSDPITSWKARKRLEEADR